MSTDQIYIRNLTVETVVGIRPHERTSTQPVRISLWLEHDIREAAISEEIQDTLDYGSISKRLTEMIQNSEFFLLEALAESITKVLQREFGVRWFRLKLSKPQAVENADDVGLIIERRLGGH